ncbi:MAG TPA: hypothetical protein VFF26_14820 [Gallionella sp.]|nr:hypothetical protein [Gallionella sp.]
MMRLPFCLALLQVLTQQPDYQAARKYWNKLKERLRKEGCESVTNCHRLKLPLPMASKDRTKSAKRRKYLPPSKHKNIAKNKCVHLFVVPAFLPMRRGFIASVG